VTEFKKPKLAVPILPSDQAKEPWYNTIEIGYAWINGYHPFDLWVNTTNCFDRMTNFTYHEKPAIKKYLADDKHSGYEKVEKTLLGVRNFTNSLWFCTSAWQSSNHFWYNHV